MYSILYHDNRKTALVLQDLVAIGGCSSSEEMRAVKASGSEEKKMPI